LVDKSIYLFSNIGDRLKILKSTICPCFVEPLRGTHFWRAVFFYNTKSPTGKISQPIADRMTPYREASVRTTCHPEWSVAERRICKYDVSCWPRAFGVRHPFVFVGILPPSSSGWHLLSNNWKNKPGIEHLCCTQKRRRCGILV